MTKRYLDILDADGRKQHPMSSGLLEYFPDALAVVSNVSFVGNEQHNPGQPMHWNRAKSMDFADTIVRHQSQAGEIDSDGVRHSAKLAWRALAQLQIELEKAYSLALPPRAVDGDQLAKAEQRNVIDKVFAPGDLPPKLPERGIV